MRFADVDQAGVVRQEFLPLVRDFLLLRLLTRLDNALTFAAVVATDFAGFVVFALVVRRNCLLFIRNHLARLARLQVCRPSEPLVHAALVLAQKLASLF